MNSPSPLSSSLGMGTETVTEESVTFKTPKFTERAKALILLRCIGADGRCVLQSEGFRLSGESLPSYSTTLQALSRHFSVTESTYVKTQRFVSVRQCTGEDYRSYLRRVEILSRSLGIFEKSLNDTLRSKAAADDSVEKLHQVSGSVNDVGSGFTVNAVRRGSSYRGDSPQRFRNDEDRERDNVETICYGCGEPGHTLKDCPEAICYRCQRRGHLAGRCSRSSCKGCGGRPHRVGSRCRGASSPPRHSDR